MIKKIRLWYLKQRYLHAVRKGGAPEFIGYGPSKTTYTSR